MFLFGVSSAGKRVQTPKPLFAHLIVNAVKVKETAGDLKGI